MVNLAPDPGLELNDASIVFDLLGVREVILAGHLGSRSNALLSATSTWTPKPPPQFGMYWHNQGASVEWSSILVADGGTYPVRVWVDGSQSGIAPDNNVHLNAYLDHGDGNLVLAATLTAGTSGWVEWEIGDIVAIGSIARVFFEAATGDDRRGAWRLDDLTVEEEEVDMAIMLAELPVRAMLATLQANLATELTGISSERGDSATIPALPAPTSWFAWRRPTALPNRCEVEVYDEGVTFPRFSHDISRWASGQRCNLSSSVTLVVGLNHANRGASAGAEAFSTAVMKVHSWRYAAAILRCIRNAPALGQGDLIMATPQEVRYSTRQSEDGMDNIDRVEVTVRCDVQESSTGETQAGQGAPPSATLESV